MTYSALILLLRAWSRNQHWIHYQRRSQSCFESLHPVSHIITQSIPARQSNSRSQSIYRTWDESCSVDLWELETPASRLSGKRDKVDAVKPMMACMPSREINLLAPGLRLKLLDSLTPLFTRRGACLTGGRDCACMMREARCYFYNTQTETSTLEI